MARVTTIVILAIAAPILVVATLSGCADKTVTVQETEQRTVSDPQMVSPGREKTE